MNFAGKLLTCCAAGAMLAACGSSDKKSGEPQPTGRDVAYTGSTSAVTISGANVASTAAFANPSGITAGPTYLGAASAVPRMDLRTPLAVFQEARRNAAVSVSGAVATVTQTCAGGGTISLSSSRASSTVSTTGDYVVMVFAACVDALGTTVNGTIRLDITATDGADPSLGPTVMTSGFTYGMKLTMTDFTIEDSTGWAGMEGDMAYSTVWNSTTFKVQSAITGTSLVTAAGVGTSVSQATRITGLTTGNPYSMESVEEYTSSAATILFANESGVNARICSTSVAGCLNFQTSPRVRQLVSQLYPASGTVKLSDDAGHWVQVTATDGATGGVTVSWELVIGAPTPDGSCSTTWAAMSTAACMP